MNTCYQVKGQFYQLDKIFIKLSMCYISNTSSMIRQNVEFQNGGNKKTKHVKFSEKRLFLTP